MRKGRIKAAAAEENGWQFLHARLPFDFLLADFLLADFLLAGFGQAIAARAECIPRCTWR